MIHSFLPANPFALARTWKIFAGAGAGKTRAIQQTMGDLITSGVAPREIMYLLFNRKPADTFREKWNLTKLDMQWWNTHHSICKQLLGRNCQILDIEEWGKTRGFKLSNDPYKEENGASGWDMAYSEVQRRIFMDELAGATASERKLFDALRQTEYEEKKFCHARYLEKALKLDLFPPGVKYVFVDEAQDNGKIQMDWLTRVAARPEVLGMMIAGDDKQAINGFKGASAELFLNFQTEAEVELTTTYRNGKQIMLEANRLVKPIKNRSSLTVVSGAPYAGLVTRDISFEDSIWDIEKAFKANKSVFVLARNRCHLPQAIKLLKNAGILSAEPWVENMTRTIIGLKDIKSRGYMLTEDNLSAIMPSTNPKQGELRSTSYWPEGLVRKFRKGQFEEDIDMFELYGELRLGRPISLDQAEADGHIIGLKADLLKWDIPASKWLLSEDDMFSFKSWHRKFKGETIPIRVETIHSMKGEEADVVVLLSDITGAVQTAERTDTDNERRVWYVAMTRAREKLIVASLNNRNNSILV